MNRTYLQVDSPFDRYAFHGCATALLFRSQDIRDKLPNCYEELWQNTGGASISWLEVPRLKSAFVCFLGEDALEYQEAVKTLLSGKTVEDLVVSAPGLPHDELLFRFYWVAYMTEHPSQLVLNFFGAGIDDARKNIRLSALNAYMIRRWPEWQQRVEVVAREDSEAEVRSLAAQILASQP